MKVENPDLKNIFDLFALCCLNILGACAKGEFKVPVEEDEQYAEIDALVEQYRYDRDIEGRSEALNNLLDKLVEVVGLDCTSQQAYDIAIAIDRNIEMEEPTCEDTSSQFVYYSSLNEHCSDKVRIFPVLQDTISIRSNIRETTKSADGYTVFRKEKAVMVSPIDKYFHNYIIMDEGNIKKYPLKIAYVRNSSLLAERYTDKNSLNVELIPLTKINLEEILNIQFKGKYFWVEGMKKEHEERLCRKQENVYLQEERTEADFVIFPEMLFSQELVQINKEKAGRAEMIVNGSIWKNEHNKSILSNGNEEILFHDKRCPFDYNKKEKNDRGEIKICTYQEKLYPLAGEEKTFMLLEIEGFGRIAIGICRDLDDANMQFLWKMMKINVLLVPAFTGSMDLDHSALDLAGSHNMVVVMCNACSAVCAAESESEVLPDNREIGFIALPGKNRRGRRRPVLKYYYKRDICRECERLCGGHRLLIHFDKITEADGIKTYTVEGIGEERYGIDER